jgi:hypothetical protein
MRRSFTHYLRLAAILVGTCSVGRMAMAGTVKMQTGLKITLHVYNWAHMDSETLTRAKQEATRIYRAIGVETVWLDHPVGGAQESTPPRASEIYVNIIPQATQGLGLFSNSLGIAPGEGRNRARLYVCYDRVESLYRKQIARVAQHKTYRGATTAQILGYAIAHEIGHLLGLDAHSDLGIMRQAWSPTDLLNLAYGDLAFTAQQAAVIRTEVEMRQQVADGVPEPRSQN